MARALTMQMLMRTVSHIQNRLTSRILNSWRSFKVERQKQRALLKRALGLAMSKLQCRIVQAWREFVVSKAR